MKTEEIQDMRIRLRRLIAPIYVDPLNLDDPHCPHMESVGCGFIVYSSPTELLMMTSWHVIEEIRRLDVIHDPPRSSVFDLPCFEQPANKTHSWRYVKPISVLEGDNGKPILGSISYIWGNTGHDMVLMYVTPKEPLFVNIKNYKSFTIDSDGPELNDEFHLVTWDRVQVVHDPVLQRCNVDLHWKIKCGKVISRDDNTIEGINKWPNFEVDIDFIEGMSGSPLVIWKDNVASICGIVTSSFDDHKTAKASILWPIYWTEVDLIGFAGDKLTKFEELVDHGFIRDKSQRKLWTQYKEESDDY